MKISISYNGHISRYYNLARELYNRGYLSRLYSLDYPVELSSVAKAGALSGDSYLKNNGALAFMHKVSGLPQFKNVISKNTARFWSGKLFDEWVSRDIDKKTDIVTCMSGMGLATMKRARDLGMISILDRTNSHIEWQTDILNAENERLNIAHTHNTKEIIERNIREYEEADYISVLSSFAKRTFLKKNVPDSKILTIPSGIDTTLFNPAEKEDKGFRVIYCGLACIKKGTHYLLDAFSSLRLKNAELWLIGGVYTDIDSMLKKHSDSYKSIGFIKHPELHKYYSQGTVFVIPSLEEGLPKAMLEAMACGLPVIATENSGAEDVIREGIEGFVIPAGDAGSLRDRISYFYEHPDAARQMGENARKRVMEEFTVERYADRVIAAYRPLYDKVSCLPVN